MLTAKQIDNLPIGFHPVIRTSIRGYGKSKKYRTGAQTIKIYQELPSGKVILRLEPRPILSELIGKSQSSFKGCKRPTVKDSRTKDETL